MEKTIIVLAAVDQHSLQFKGADVEETHCETVGEAKARAKYVLTTEYQRITESSQKLGYSQVIVNGVCVADYDSHN